MQELLPPNHTQQQSHSTVELITKIISGPHVDTVTALTGEMIITPQQGDEIMEPKPLSQPHLSHLDTCTDAATAVPVVGANPNLVKSSSFQTAIGILGNSSLPCLYNFSLLTGHKGYLKQWLLLDRNVSWMMLHVNLVGTGVSFSTICLLNGFQAIKLNPSICRWMNLKLRSPKFIVFCSFLCWILHLLMNSCIPIIVNGPLNSKNLSVENNCGYCSWTMPERFSSLYTVMYFSLDFMSLGFMVRASGSMVFILLRHKQRVQHIHSKRFFHRLSHEARATYTILILVRAFVTFYSIYTILTFWMT
ncbi:hypothetical protein HPG69_007267 [Diceros bicornis minor]|uniref:Vomeronasal type-1 receptor n=1 Tax=Diceros bicornis minor TaxID=77932 RepID=A0A7J7FPL7_DICBM|nr:hypothetical protein HPG69_007267 [Diceros bicornis minor]